MSNLVKGQSAVLFTQGKFMCGDNHSPVKSIGTKRITLENGFWRSIDSDDVFIASTEAAQHQLVHAFDVPAETALTILTVEDLQTAVELFRDNITCYRRRNWKLMTEIVSELRDTHAQFNK